MTSVFEPSDRPLLHRVVDRAAEHLIPFHVALELTYRCNLRCKHCYIDVPAEDELAFTEWREVLDQLVSAGSLYVLLTGGEPLIRSDFFHIATYARERGLIPMLLTNGTLITRGIAEDIAKLRPLFVCLSLYGATDSIHEGITGRVGSFRATVRAITLLQELGVAVVLQAMLMDSNVHEVVEMRRLADSLGVQLRVGYDLAPTKSGALAPQCHEVGIGDLCMYSEHLSGSITVGLNKYGVCKAGRALCSISPTGNVFPCIMMPLRLGNIRQERFSEIWRSHPTPELTYLRSITRDDLYECKECDVAMFCTSCMGRNLTETGELTRPAPSTCRNAALKSQILARKGVNDERALPEACDAHGES